MQRSSYFCIAGDLCMTSWPHYTSWPAAASLHWQLECELELLAASFTVKPVTRDEQITSLSFFGSACQPRKGPDEAHQYDAGSWVPLCLEPHTSAHTRAADGHTTARIHSKYSLPHHVPVAYVALFATSHPQQHGLNP